MAAVFVKSERARRQRTSAPLLFKGGGNERYPPMNEETEAMLKEPISPIIEPLHPANSKYEVLPAADVLSVNHYIATTVLNFCSYSLIRTKRGAVPPF